MASLQPLTLHAHPGPNPWKIAILLSELSIPYTTVVHTTPELKQSSFLALNRNGMSPVLSDPNTDLLLAESGAITDYILDQYDSSAHLISFSSLHEKYLAKQWLQFQVTMQGPMLQHIFFFTSAAPNAEARAKYVRDILRVLRGLDDELAGKEWLVGGRCSAADLSYVPFTVRMDAIMGGDKPDLEKDYPNVDAWFKRMLERPSVQKVQAEWADAFQQSLNRDPNLAKRFAQR